MSDDKLLVPILTPNVIAPEYVEVADCYISCRLDVREAAALLNVTPEYVSGIINMPSVNNYINTIENSRGLRNSRTFFEEMEEIIAQKKRDMLDSELGSSADILELMQAMHKMKMEEEKLALKRLELEVKRESARIAGSRGKVSNTQVNIGTGEGIAKGLPSVLQAIMEAK